MALDVNRRGFLKGSASLLGTALLLNVVDVLPVQSALRREVPSENSALWTPESIVQPQHLTKQIPLPHMQALRFSVSRVDSEEPLVTWGLSLRGSMRWVPAPGDEVIITDGQSYGSVMDVFVSYMPLG